jgi:hypothetical protein
MIQKLKFEPTLRSSDQRMRYAEIHDHDCDCATCAPYVPSDPDRLTATHMGKLACLGVVVGSAIMFAIDPAGAGAALLATIGY